MCKRWLSIFVFAGVLAGLGAGIAVAYKPTIIRESNLPFYLNGGFRPTKLPKDNWRRPISPSKAASSLPARPP